MNQLPHPRFNATTCVVDDVLYIYGGIFEKGEQEFNLDSFYAIDLGRLDGVKVFWEDLSELEKSEANSDEEEDDEDEDDEEEGDEDEVDNILEDELEEEEVRKKTKKKKLKKNSPMQDLGCHIQNLLSRCVLFILVLELNF